VLITVNSESAALDHCDSMVTSADELIRLDLRIADLERRVARERMNAGSDSHYMHRAERSQMLQMLVRTLDTMKAEKILGASIKKSGRLRQPSLVHSQRHDETGERIDLVLGQVMVRHHCGRGFQPGDDALA
jgi:hypothetical protein